MHIGAPKGEENRTECLYKEIISGEKYDQPGR